jgi:hypothetical protein
MYPQLGSAHRKGYFDVGSELPGFDNHGYVSVEFVEQAAQHLNWHSPDTVSEIEAELESYKHRVAQLEDEVRELNKDFDAIEVLQSRGYTARKKPGRKPGPKEPIQ